MNPLLGPPSRAPQAIATIFAAGLLACDATQPSADRPLIPLAVGNTWVYEVQSLPGAPADTVVSALTSRIVAEVEGVARELFAEQTYPSGSQPGPADPAWFFGNEPDGYYLYGGAVAGDTMFLRTPWILKHHRGATWLQDRMVYDFGQAAWRVLEAVERTIYQTEVPCDTPLGSRRCVEVRYYLPPIEDDVAFGDWHQVLVAPGIGMVRHDLYRDDAYLERVGSARLIRLVAP